ncbi:putative Nudix hydrolase NudL [Koleobacter methoxysyntrophicus]|uniref:Putative Nudix hydrolase NudL n=1 Tax=Koleobacter methoxysyntrophicus TaxID=2751313 RepID=A0A8A0RLB0_9FIRM|nr:CoA pyrophosphatase [Koleobacter methoxysyntrophicus]QSQ08016.1 putative Nudix hydrolase NudL [Koleobacter methoxysyntrophicus]
MDINRIKQKIAERKPKPEMHNSLFSVFLPLIHTDKGCNILFEIRSQSLDKQPGEICFPGGGIEEGETALDSAVRETCEELNVPLNRIEVFGPLDYVITPYNIVIYPFAGRLEVTDTAKIEFNREEVSDIFTVPLDYLLKCRPLVHYVDVKTVPGEDFPFSLVQNGREYNWRTGRYPVFFYKYKDFIIWGLTARILKNFLDIIRC